jgi:hypothetical protein
VPENVTHKNVGFSDAAELFVFFAGYAGACAYFGRYLRGDRLGLSLHRYGIMRFWQARRSRC